MTWSRDGQETAQDASGTARAGCEKELLEGAGNVTPVPLQRQYLWMLLCLWAGSVVHCQFHRAQSHIQCPLSALWCPGCAHGPALSAPGGQISFWCPWFLEQNCWKPHHPQSRRDGIHLELRLKPEGCRPRVLLLKKEKIAVGKRNDFLISWSETCLRSGYSTLQESNHSSKQGEQSASY